MNCFSFWIFAVAAVSLAGRVAALDYDPVLLGKWTSAQDAWAVTVRSNFAYVANDVGGLQVISISNPVNPVRVGGYVTPGAAVGVTLGSLPTANYAYVAAGPDGVEVINISNPTNVLYVGNIGFGSFIFSANGAARPTRLAIVGGHTCELESALVPRRG